MHTQNPKSTPETLVTPCAVVRPAGPFHSPSIGRIRQHGARSAQVVAFPRTSNRPSVYNLAGGADPRTAQVPASVLQDSPAVDSR